MRIRHPHRREQVAGRRALNDTAGVHHRDLVGSAGDNGEVVRYEDHRHVPPALLACQQVEDLRLDGDVERRRRLVGDQQARLAGERDGDGDALAHPARELVRILPQPLLGRGNADSGEQLDASRSRSRRADFKMLPQAFAQLGAECQHRIERAHRVLKHHGKCRAAQAS